MRESKLHVEPQVNTKLVDADERQINHPFMTDGSLTFQDRFDAVMSHLKLKYRTDFAKMLGVTENPSQVASNWYNREQRVPLEYRKRLEVMKISLDWLNDNEGAMSLPVLQLPASPQQSQPLQLPHLSIALRLYDEELAGERLSYEKRAELLTLIMDLLDEGMSEAKVLRFVRAAK